MKPNRSNKYTTGLCDTIDKSRDRRFCFFEVDDMNNDNIIRVNKAYRQFGLDFLVHRTQKGWHWLSPTEVTRAEWKAFHALIKDINTECPMTCMRVEPNKYPDETGVWYLSSVEYNNFYPERNNYELCVYLNHIWGVKFHGTGKGSIQTVNYPLPIVESHGYELF